MLDLHLLLTLIAWLWRCAVI